MAKKFGKLLLFAAAAGASVAAVRYYLHKKNAENMEPEEEDYDDFGEDSQTYVPLPLDPKDEEAGNAAAETEAAPETGAFTPLKDSVAHAAAKADEAIENVEEFFDEEDNPDAELPVNTP